MYVMISVTVRLCPSRHDKNCNIGIFVDTINEMIEWCSSWKLCESRGGCPGLPVPNKPGGFCGCKATLKLVVVCVEPHPHHKLAILLYV